MGFTLQHSKNKTFNSGRKLLLLTQHYEPVSYKMLHHRYDTPTFKPNVFHLVTNEGRLKRLLQLYKWLI